MFKSTKVNYRYSHHALYMVDYLANVMLDEIYWYTFGQRKRIKKEKKTTDHLHKHNANISLNQVWRAASTTKLVLEFVKMEIYIYF